MYLNIQSLECLLFQRIQTDIEEVPLWAKHSDRCLKISFDTQACQILPVSVWTNTAPTSTSTKNLTRMSE